MGQSIKRGPKYKYLNLDEKDWTKLLSDRRYFNEDGSIKTEYSQNFELIDIVKQIKRSHREIIFGDCADTIV